MAAALFHSLARIHFVPPPWGFNTPRPVCTPFQFHNPLLSTHHARHKRKRENGTGKLIQSRAQFFLFFFFSLSFSVIAARAQSPHYFSALSPLTPHFRFPHFPDLRKHQTRLFRQWIQMCVYLFTRRKVFCKMHAAPGKMYKKYWMLHKAPFFHE